MSDEKKAWDAGADIPEEPTERLIIAGSGGRMWESGPMPMGTFDSLRAAAESSLHPTGRCTCGGEGRCAWCQEICRECMGSCVGDEAWLVCEACNGTGYTDGVVLTTEERAAKVAAIRADVADYEALGYPETDYRTINLGAYHVVAGNIGFFAGCWAANFGIEISVPTEIMVDGGDPDSYK